MLGSEVADLNEEVLSEVLSLLPSYEGKSVLALGMAQGRLTGELAKKAAQVIVVDHAIQGVAEKSESTDGKSENMKILSADVTSPSFSFSPHSMDLIVVNKLLMYLSDQEVEKLAERMMEWLKHGGFIFFRESCFPLSGENKPKTNLVNYREPRFYTKVFKECQMKDEHGNAHELSLICCKCIEADVKNNKDQHICWIWQKVEPKDDKEFQQFLDTVQYRFKDILRYERVFGAGFVSPGGMETTREFVSRLDLKRGQKVLDVGCGIGGVDFYMAENFDVEVIGIDLSVNMISLALERAIGGKCSVHFEVADCTKIEYPENTFDVIYSRDTILHIQDKPSLFRSFYKWLKPGGKVLITDYCRRAGEPSPEFAAYIKQRGYDLHDVQTYGQMLTDAGFSEVNAEDRTNQFMKVLQKELDTVENEKAKFISDFSEEDYDHIVEGWKAKLIRSTSGEQRWGLFIGCKKGKGLLVFPLAFR